MSGITKKALKPTCSHKHRLKSQHVHPRDLVVKNMLSVYHTLHWQLSLGISLLSFNAREMPSSTVKSDNHILHIIH